jgi:signal transduction histidine kinase
LIICAGTLGLGLALRGCSLQEAHFPLTLAAALANLVSAIAAFVRAREFREETRGWNLFGAALFLLVFANLGTALGYRYPGLSSSLRIGPIVLGLISQALCVASLVCMPWLPDPPQRRTRNLLGSCLFVGSILLILWTLTNWDSGFRQHSVINLALLAASGRLALLGGMTLYFLEQNARRIQGVLGFILLNVLLGAFYVALLQTFLVRGMIQVLPWVSVYALSPLILGLAAWSRAPLDFPTATPEHPRLWLVLPYATFALAAVGILLRYLLAGRVDTVPLVGFIVLTWLLLYRQFLLLKELRMDNQSLEDRVNARTRDLEEMQATALRTERLNTIASLGAGLAHDLNNFLGVIRSSTDLIQHHVDQGMLPEAKHLTRIKASTDRATSLTGRLMNLARRDPDPPMLMDLREELAQLEELLRMLLPPAIELRLEWAPGCFPLLSRRANLEQILVNLVANAKDAMPEGGLVTIGLTFVQGPGTPLIQLQVEDTGPGLPSRVLEHLFEYFITTKSEGKGTGLGLATVKLLVASDHGTIRMASGPGEGCRFIITYPLAPV